MTKRKYPEEKEKNGEKEKRKFLSLWIFKYFYKEVKN
jgi:hypothetical protein